MFSIIVCIVSGLAMAVQGVFNSKLSEKIGLWETNFVVQTIAFVVSLCIFIFQKNNDLKNFKSINKLYLLSGFLGVIILYTVMRGISSLGPSYATMIILVSQVLIAALIEKFGLFSVQKISFSITNYLGIILMIIGIILFKFKT